MCRTHSTNFQCKHPEAVGRVISGMNKRRRGAGSRLVPRPTPRGASQSDEQAVTPVPRILRHHHEPVERSGNKNTKYNAERTNQQGLSETAEYRLFADWTDRGTDKRIHEKRGRA